MDHSTGSTTSASSGRLSTPARRHSSGGCNQDEQDSRMHASHVEREAGAVLAIIDDQDKDAEGRRSSAYISIACCESNQRPEVEAEPHRAAPSRPPAHDAPIVNQLQRTHDDEPKAPKIQRLRSIKSTLQITKKQLVRVASSVRTQKHKRHASSHDIGFGANRGANNCREHGARGVCPLDCSTETRSVRQDSRLTQACAQYAMNALEKLEPRAQLYTRAIRPETAWKALLILPSSPFWVPWNTLHLLALAYICTVVPFITALPLSEVEHRGDWTYVMNRAIDVFYVLDVVVNFRACYLDDETGDIVTNPRLVAQHYVTQSVPGFLFDIVMAVPLDLILLGGDTDNSSISYTCIRLFRLVRLAKLVRLLKLGPFMDHCEDHYGISRNKIIVVELVAAVAFVAHLTACGFILAANVPSSHDDSWLVRNDLVDAPRSEVYVAALYWTFTMMTTVGFGDIVPVTLAERVYAIVAMVMSAGTYAYVIASMSSIVSLMNLQQTRYSERMNELNAYMTSQQLPRSLALRTRQFYRYYLTKKSVFDEHALLDALPQNLRQELVEHHVKTAMRHIRFFHEVKQRGFIGHITLLLRPVFYPPTSVIIKARDHASDMFFITKGTCEVFLGTDHRFPVSPEHSLVSVAKGTVAAIAHLVGSRRASAAADVNEPGEQLVALLKDGDYFGEMALLCDAPQCRRTASVRVVTFCELYSLSYAHLSPALEKYRSVEKQLRTTAQARLDELHDLQREHFLPGTHAITIDR